MLFIHEFKTIYVHVEVCSLMKVHFNLQEWFHKCSRCDPSAVKGLTGKKMAKICTEQSYPSQRSAFTPEPAIEWIERGERSEDIYRRHRQINHYLASRTIISFNEVI